MLSRFYLIPESYGQTDGQTDRIAVSISRVSVLTRDKNEPSTNDKLCSYCVMPFKRRCIELITRFSRAQLCENAT